MATWIKTEDRLPDNDREVLMLSQYKGDDCGIKISRYYDGRWLYASNLGYTVSHWMELPEPPNK